MKALLFVLACLLWFVLTKVWKALYTKSYPGDNSFPRSVDRGFEDYLTVVRKHYSRHHYYGMSLGIGDGDFETYAQPDDPTVWRSHLVSRQRWWYRRIGEVASSLVAFLLISFVQSSMGPNENLMFLLVMLASGLAVVLMCRLRYLDGLTQGYLDGYADAVHAEFVRKLPKASAGPDD